MRSQTTEDGLAKIEVTGRLLYEKYGLKFKIHILFHVKVTARPLISHIKL